MTHKQNRVQPNKANRRARAKVANKQRRAPMLHPRRAREFLQAGRPPKPPTVSRQERGMQPAGRRRQIAAGMNKLKQENQISDERNGMHEEDEQRHEVRVQTGARRRIHVEASNISRLYSMKIRRWPPSCNASLLDGGRRMRTPRNWGRWLATSAPPSNITARAGTMSTWA